MIQSELRTRSGSAAALRSAVEVPLPGPVGPWEAVELAAEGNWSQIYRARPLESPADRPAAYALKMLRPQRQEDAWGIALLAREALAGNSISHPHLIPVLDASVSRAPRFVVMPWLEGATLQARLAAGELMDVPAALWIARQVAEALQALETGGWMHGDVKPSNIFLSPEGHVTLLDLGFARRRDETCASIDRCVMGTCNYLAPECITSAGGGDIRSDIYSLGAVLFEVLSGRLPLEGDTLAEIAARHRQTAAPNLLKLVPQLPTEIAWLVRRTMAKDPLRRPQTARELIQQLIGLEIATFSERALA